MSNQGIATERKKYKIIGTRPVRHDGIEKVTGAALYGADFYPPGLLYGKVLRSPHAHARIKSIDTTKAEAVSGVMAVATSADLPAQEPIGRVDGPPFVRENVLASRKVLYKGQSVAAVAATNPHVAEEALDLIDVVYEPLGAVTNVDDATKDNAPVLHENWLQDTAADEDAAYQHPNVSKHERYEMGDLESGFAAADQIFEREFRTKTVHQGYIEPQTTTAWWSPEGRLTIWCSSQGHFGMRDGTAEILDIPISQIKVVPMEIGGGFGGKLSPYLEPVAAILSKKSGHPVKITMSRADVFQATGPTAGSRVKIKIGVTDEGRMTAAQGTYYFEGGAYMGAPLTPAAAAIFAPYNVENAMVDGYEVVTNKPSTKAYRAPGAPIVAFATESVVDEIAEELGIDPMELRLTNAAREGDRRVDRVKNGPIGAEQVMRDVLSHPHYQAPIDTKWTGRGVSMGFCRNNTGPASLVANVLDDGTVNILEGSVDIGGSRTAIAQQFAEVLGIPVEDVNPTIGDTDSIGYTSNTGGSGVAFKSGWAAYEAANDVIRQLVKRAALIWDVDSTDVEYSDGEVHHISDTELRMSFKELAEMLSTTGGPVVGRANLDPAGHSGSYSASIVDVEVDPETGKVQILRCTAFQDAGTAIHPSYVEGQIQGGTAQGVGWALNEEYFMGGDGQMENTTLLDYRMPTSLDLPMIDPVIVEVPNPGHPFGVRGVGEANISAPLAAVANAIHNATGVRLRDLPMNPGAVSQAVTTRSNG